MKRPKLVVSCVKFDASLISSALRVTQNEVLEAFRDGRGAWPFSEMWGKTLYEFIKHSNSNKPLSDGMVALDQLRDFNISVKALSKNGVKFQQSKDVGFGRTSTKEGLLVSLESCDRVIVVDLTEFPDVNFLPLDTTRLVSAVHKGELGIAGWKKAKLYRWINATYEVSHIELAI
jgi:hypothetical protein